ncbi:hypothetical protein M427DRAFT_76148, partial [Gonapodya prolifera JEL478]
MMCSESYKKLLDRFPKSKMVLRLYSQFHSVVLTDAEEARRLLSLAEELEDTSNASAFSTPLEISPSVVEAQFEMKVPERSPSMEFVAEDGQHGPNVSKYNISLARPEENMVPLPPIEAPVRRSSRKATSSHGSSTSEGREARRARAMRMEFTRRVKSVPQTYSRRLQVIMVIIGATIVFALAYSNMVFATLDDAASEFLLTTDIGRIGIALCQGARLMGYWASKGNIEEYQRWKNELSVNHDRFASVAMPYLNGHSGLDDG